MLKTLVLLIFPLLLISCKENNKEMLQNLIDKQDFVNAKVLTEELLNKENLDPFYNGVMAYILTVECVSTNCSVNEPEKLEDIARYSKKANGLVNVSDLYFIDYYNLTIEKLVKYAVKLDTIESATVALEEFNQATNKRRGLIYDKLIEETLSYILADNIEKSVFALSLIQSLNFDLTEEKKVSIDLLLAFLLNKPVLVMQDKIENFNRDFIGKKLPEETLVLMAPVLVEYALRKDINPVELLEKTAAERPKLLNKNAALLNEKPNFEAYAKGIEYVSNSKKLLERFSLLLDREELDIKANIENISLSLYPDNAPLWKTYIKNLAELKQLASMYDNIDIDGLSAKSVMSNNDMILDIASKELSSGSIIVVLNEMVFREDSQKKQYTQKVYDLVEEALKVEISKNNLDGIFEYLNYIPSMKSKFKDELNSKLKEYIQVAWDKNDFTDLDNLVDLYNDLNDKKSGAFILDLYEESLSSEDATKFFTAKDIKELARHGSADSAINKNIEAKYNYVKEKINHNDLQTRVFSIVRKMPGVYTQAKVFIFYSDIFSKDKRNGLIIDTITNATDKDYSLNLERSIELANYLLANINILPDNYIKNIVIPKIGDTNDLILVWEKSNAKTKRELIKYNRDIEYLIKAKQADRAGNKITASKYISRIKSKEVLSFVNKYKNSYKSYVRQIAGYYVKEGEGLGPEVILVKPTKTLLQVELNFISKLGKIENLDKYKLDRGEILSKNIKEDFNPVKANIMLDVDYSKKERKIFLNVKQIKFADGELLFGKQKYKKVKSLFEYNKEYGIVHQITTKTKDNFHILPEGSSLAITQQVSGDVYKIKIKHPATQNETEVMAKYNPTTVSFDFEYDYFIKLLNKNFSAKARCQFIDYKVYCAVQDEHWKRENYSVILKGLEVKR